MSLTGKLYIFVSYRCRIWREDITLYFISESRSYLVYHCLFYLHNIRNVPLVYFEILKCTKNYLWVSFSWGLFWILCKDNHMKIMNFLSKLPFWYGWHLKQHLSINFPFYRNQYSHYTLTFYNRLHKNIIYLSSLCFLTLKLFQITKKMHLVSTLLK